MQLSPRQLEKLEQHHIALNDQYGAHNYSPYPVVMVRGKMPRFGTSEASAISIASDVIPR